MGDSFKLEFDSFYRANYPVLFRTAIRITGNRHTSEDLVDEAFIIYLQKSKEIKIGNPSAYVTQILTNLVGNYLKSQRRKKYELLPLDTAANLIEDTNGLHRPLADILPDSLLPWEREILILRYENRYSHKEIASLLGIKEVACRSRLLRATVHCQELMLENEKKLKSMQRSDDMQKQNK